VDCGLLMTSITASAAMPPGRSMIGTAQD